jgi:TonB family protein
MKTKMLGCIMLLLAGVLSGQGTMSLCPRHIETPFYPSIARTANVYGRVFLLLTIDADGKVTDAEVSNVAKSTPLLQPDTISNIRRWSFAKPPFSPYQQQIEYDYEIDRSLPLNGATQVTFDLPDRVTIVTSETVINTSRSSSEK